MVVGCLSAAEQGAARNERAEGSGEESAAAAEGAAAGTSHNGEECVDAVATSWVALWPQLVDAASEIRVGARDDTDTWRHVPSIVCECDGALALHDLAFAVCIHAPPVLSADEPRIAVGGEEELPRRRSMQHAQHQT